MPESQPPVAPQHRPSPWTLPGLILDRCHEPCPSVIPNTDQPRPNTDLRVWTQYYPNTGPIQTTVTCVIRVKPRQLHQVAVSTNPSSSGHVIQCHYLWGYSENYWGFQGYSPFQCVYGAHICTFNCACMWCMYVHW